MTLAASRTQDRLNVVIKSDLVGRLGFFLGFARWRPAEADEAEGDECKQLGQGREQTLHRILQMANRWD
jgi:hypothetical protein